ncbi:unnamed protein product [Phytomonas sp. EM1]|nr:unnamed protein product [Phytomonas sp. EM1]|eukprot:CCW62760.1 unnamed protein product [Phytomonas sp. isolate EM1]
MASIPVPELGPNAELRILLFPFGGRNPELYQRMGWDRMLGSFQEALTLVMVLNGVEGGLHHYLALNSDANNEEEDVIRSLGLLPLGTEVTRHPEANGTPTETSEDGNRARSMPTVNILEEKIIDAFANGMSKCRKIIRTKPLSFLTSGAEAIDFSLLRQDSGKSIQLAKFMHTPSKRLTKKMQADFIKLAEWAGQIITQSSYMKAYVREHAYWLGFGSGTSEPFLNSPDVDESGKVTPNFRVKGFQNIVVGDCSSVSNEVFSSRSCNSNALSAGSVSTAIDAGRLAAQSIAAI